MADGAPKTYEAQNLLSELLNQPWMQEFFKEYEKGKDK